jgi:hypothetical protein
MMLKLILTLPLLFAVGNAIVAKLPLDSVADGIYVVNLTIGSPAQVDIYLKV